MSYGRSGQDETRANLITATCGSAAIASFFMGAFANMPIGLAPGLGLNAYFGRSLHLNSCTPSRAAACAWLPSVMAEHACTKSREEGESKPDANRLQPAAEVPVVIRLGMCVKATSASQA